MGYWVKENFPNKGIQFVNMFIGQNIDICAANSSKIELDVVLVLKFNLNEQGDSVLIPVLVSSDSLANPILGYNVIEHLIVNKSPDIDPDLKNAFGGISNSCLET